MALDIGLESTTGTDDPLDRKLVVSLEEGELAFMFEAIEEFRLQTGIEIIQYDDVRLQEEQLRLFEQLLIKIIDEVKRKPNQWEELFAFEMPSPSQKRQKPREYYAALFKSEFLKKLKNLLQLTREAYDYQRVLFFFGD